MAFCFVLTPAFSMNSPDISTLSSSCADSLGVEVQDIELFTLVPLKDITKSREVVIKVKQNSFSLSFIEDLLTQRDQLQLQVQRSRDALIAYSQKLELQPDLKIPIDEKYAKKLAKLSEDNKKLRLLLKTQLENAEKLRSETQKTVENLRQEFDTLVKELLQANESKNLNLPKNITDKKLSVPRLKL
ncbi:unnamed protein product [Blepharisma stoltei]|uniref:Uncharacterized protein n=1 Tax=Blepharisma stoltei TaxID=1481888 RepID=A0AAU9ICA4_9CILI|nr:unnamed protein product [Blepharisma stoltei]